MTLLNISGGRPGLYSMARISSSRLLNLATIVIVAILLAETLRIVFIEDLRTGQEKKNIKKIINFDIEKSVNEHFFEKIAGTNWTLFDIRRGKLKAGKKEIIGVQSEEILPKYEIQPSASNRTQETHILLYNRVPKCASTSMISILRQLARRNNFRFVSSSLYHR